MKAEASPFIRPRYIVSIFKQENVELTFNEQDVSAASIYLTAKLTGPLNPRSVINVYAYLCSPEASPLWFVNPNPQTEKPAPETYYVSEGTFEAQRLELFKLEMRILRTLGFDMHIVIPHTIALTYLQTMNATSPRLAKRVFQHLNSALLSPQLLYVTHQPNALAVAAIYLAAREVGVKLVEEEWWEVFDVDREELGFLVVAMNSMEGFAKAERETWAGRSIPLTVEAVEEEMKRRVAREGS